MDVGAIEIAAPPDEVWAKVGDFGGVDKIMPGIDSCVLEGDDRVLAMFGLTIRERLVDRDEAARSLTYSVVEGVPLERHRATISVEPEGDGSRVTWTFEVEPAEMAPIFADTYRQALEALKTSFS